MARRYRYQVIQNSSATLYIASDIQQQQSLASGQTYVCQFDVYDTPTINLGDQIDIRAVNIDTNTYVYQFRGTVNRISASHFPGQLTVYCSGPLAKLRRARRSSDFNFTGYTDGAAVKSVLDYCGITYTDADIQSYGLTLGGIEPVYFKKGQSGADFIAQLDDVLGMTTMETFNGRVVRIPFSRIPADYSTSYATYRADGNNVVIYSNQRDYGNLDNIANIVEVTGISYECGPEDECNCTIIANSDAANPLLGSGVRTQPLTFSSEFIQSEQMAYRVATRLMRENNRVTDALVLETANDPNMWPARCISVIDNYYGFGMSSATKYVVTDVNRSGDFMTLNLIGGAAGATGSPAVDLVQECNDDETTGGDVPDEVIPDVPLVDIPPVTAPVICPDAPVDPEEEPRFINCIDQDGTVGNAIVPPNELGIVAWQHIRDSSWRIHASDSSVSAKLSGEVSGVVEEILVHASGSRSFYLNLEPGSNSDKSSAGDVSFGPGPLVSISGEVWFAEEHLTLHIYLDRPGTSLGAGAVHLHSSPGQLVDLSSTGGGVHYWAAIASAEQGSARFDEDTAAHSWCRHPANDCNNGGYMGMDTGLPIQTWVPFTIYFDLAATLQRVDVDAGPASGYYESHEKWGTEGVTEFPFANSPCNHSDHNLRVFTSTPSATSWTATNPAFKLKLDGVGYGTCEVNPNHGVEPEPPTGPDGVPCTDAESTPPEAP